MKYLIKNWDHFQHYHDRNPPWIKLHFDLLSSSDWVSLDDTSRVLAIACMLIASRSKGEKGEIDGSEVGLAYLKRVAYLNKTPNLKPLIICGFLVPASMCKQMQADACTSVSSLYVSDSVSVSEDKGCGEKGKKEQKSPYGEFHNVKLTDSELEKLEAKFGKADTSQRIENLSQYIASNLKGKKYVDHYATILQWASREQKGATNGSRSAHSQSPRNHPTAPGKYAHLGTVIDPGGED